MAAAPVPLTLLEQCRDKGIGILQTYGLTEAGGPGTNLSADDAQRKIGSAGRAYTLTDVKVARPDGTPCDPDEPGEVLVRGRHLMIGYWNNPAATEAALVDGWLHTGDVAVMDERGYIRITDRTKDMFIVGGFNAYPAEIENLLLGHPAVGRVAVVGMPDARLGEVGMAFVVPAPDAEVDPEELIAWARAAMANYKVPRAVEVVDDLPVNAAGKVEKETLRARAASFPGRSRSAVPRSAHGSTPSPERKG